MVDDTLKGAAPGRASEVRCRHCQDRVLVVTARREDALKWLAVHMDKDHPERKDSHLILQGSDFMIGLAPYRCDLCCGITEPPWWTYTTVPAAQAEDPDWLVCEHCHDLIVAHHDPLEALVARSLEVQYATLILESDPDKVRAAVQQSLANFVRHRLDTPVRSQS